MEEMGWLTEFYRGRRVLVTGHTGFKGSWLCRILIGAGALVTGYSLDPPTEPNLFDRAGLRNAMRSITGDVRDGALLMKAFQISEPEVVFHLAAQPLVRESYISPKDTYETNVMGTVNCLECVRKTPSVRSVLNVTTDKVYRNRKQRQGYREEDQLDGYDPYSNSKSCSELVTHSYIRCFFQGSGAPAVSTVRAGNVIGGGDFAKDRLIPDCLRAVWTGKPVEIRNSASVRPFQHVLDPLAVYLMIAQRQYEKREYAGSYNVGPDQEDSVTAARIAELFCGCWGEGATWISREEKNAPHEDELLLLNCEKLKSVFGWKPRWHIEEAIRMTCRFSRTWIEDGDIPEEMDKEVELFFRG